MRNLLEYFPAVAQWLRVTRDHFDRHDPATITPWGFSLAGSEIMAGGTFEQAETVLVRELLTEADLFVNVGANVGYYCCHALSVGTPVIAVEPIARNLHYLMVNMTNNGWANRVEIFPVALGSEPSILPIWGGGTGASLIKGWASISESYVTRVPVLTLDRVLGGSIRGKKTLILVDIEGSELMMLRGALQTLENEPRPIWMVETSLTEHQPRGTLINPYFAETFSMFFDRGYKAFPVDEIDRQFTQADVKRAILDVESLNFHNFVFR